MRCLFTGRTSRLPTFRHLPAIVLAFGSLLTATACYAQAAAEDAAVAVQATAPVVEAAAGEAVESTKTIGWSLDPATWLGGIERLVDLGGTVVLLQLGISVIGFAIVLFKVLQFVQVRSGSLAALHAAIETWVGGNPRQGGEMFKRNSLPFARDVALALEQLRPDNIEIVREELFRRARLYLQPLHDYMATIEMIYYIAPLLGLLGTVTGIIASFQALEASGAANDAAKLAGGIWEALICTGVGLSMAIPFAVLHSLLDSRLNHIVSAVEDVIARVFTASLEQAPTEVRKRA